MILFKTIYTMILLLLVENPTIAQEIIRHHLFLNSPSMKLSNQKYYYIAVPK